MRKAHTTAALAITAVLLLGGCAPPDPVVAPPSEPVVEPVFASDEEALAAATEAYERYLKVSDEIGHDGGANPERLASYVTEESLADEVAQFDVYTDSAVHSKGAYSFDVLGLQHYHDIAPGSAEVVLYVCLDVTAVEIFNEDGDDVTLAGRENRLPLEVGFESSEENSQLLFSRSDRWSGSNTC